jgi:hypothetical protein
MNNIRYILLALALITAGLIVYKSQGIAEDKTAKGGNPVVLIKTSKGDIKVELDKEKAPISVENFLSYVNDGYYNGTIFHRVIKNFMIQGGGFTADMKQKPAKDPIKTRLKMGYRTQGVL